VDFTEEDWDAVVDTNLKSVFFLCQAAGRHMIAHHGQTGQRGKIINIASMLSFQGGIRVPLHRQQIGRGRADETAGLRMGGQGHQRQRHRAGLYRHQQHRRASGRRGAQPPDLERIPEGRWGSPADMGGAAVFLASGAADYVQGHVLAVDGGWLAR
jgi:2-deoxy-D-gluconate 3-dehydrogenase